VENAVAVKNREQLENKTGMGSSVSTRSNQDKLNGFTARVRKALNNSVAGIMEIGLVLIEAKSELKHGQFTNWLVDDLRFGKRLANGEADIRKAEMLMSLVRHEVISNPCHWHAFPPSPRTLWELTQIQPKQRLLELIGDGTINSAMTREEAIALRPSNARQRRPAPKLRREIATLLDVCIRLGGADVVLAPFAR
jgi:hypothetical protein